MLDLHNQKEDQIRETNILRFYSTLKYIINKINNLSKRRNYKVTLIALSKRKLEEALITKTLEIQLVNG